MLIAALALLGAPPFVGAQGVGDVFRKVQGSVWVIRAKGARCHAGGPTTFSEIGSGVLIAPDGR